MTARDFDIVPLSEALGVEVRGVRLGRELSVHDGLALRRLFDEHHLLLFRNQSFSGDQQRQFCDRLRPVVDPVAWVSNVEPGFHPEGELLFHCDYAFTPHPMLGLSLYAVEMADGAAPTCFANNARALGRLPDGLRRRLEEVRIVHMIDAVSGRDNIRTRISEVGGPGAPTDAYPRFARPAIWTHPVTGAPLLFVLQQQASHVEGWTCAESDELIDAAFGYLYEPANVYAHEWRVGDFVVWDNLALQHGRPANPNPVRRSLRRVAMNHVSTAALIAGTGFDPAWRRAAADRTEPEVDGGLE
jgi:taurine dioxygenase